MKKKIVETERIYLLAPHIFFLKKFILKLFQNRFNLYFYCYNQIYLYLFLDAFLFSSKLTKSNLSISFRKLFPTGVHFLHSILTRQPLAVHIAMEHPAIRHFFSVFEWFFSPPGINQIDKLCNFPHPEASNSCVWKGYQFKLIC